MSNWKQQIKNQAIQKSMAKVQEGFMGKGKDYVIETTQKKIKELVYDSYDPDDYERTYDLLESWELLRINKNGKKEVKYLFGHNSAKIRKSRAFGIWQHASQVQDGNPYVGHLLPAWIHNGKVSNKVFGTPDSWHEPKPYRDEAVKTLRLGLKDVIIN